MTDSPIHSDSDPVFTWNDAYKQVAILAQNACPVSVYNRLKLSKSSGWKGALTIYI
jgi:hypothetical protein